MKFMDSKGWFWLYKLDRSSEKWIAEDGRGQRIVEATEEALQSSIQAADPANPRVDAVAIVDPVPGIGATTNL